MSVPRIGRGDLARRMILFGIWLSTLYWVLESLLNAYYYKEAPVLEQVFSPTIHQVWARLLVISLIFISSLFGQIAFERRRAAEAAAKWERELSQKYLDAAGAIFIVVDADQKVKLINRKGCESSGYTEEEVVGRNWFDTFVPEEARSRAKSNYEKMLAGEIELFKRFHSPLLTKDGEERIVAWQSAPLIDESDTISGTIILGEDITDRKKVEETLQESETKYSTLVEQAKDGVVIIQDGLVKFVNEAMAEIVRYQPGEVMERSFLDFIAPESRELVAEKHRARLTGREVNAVYEAKLLRKDGSECEVEISGGVIQYHGHPAVMGLVRDITQRKQAEEALRFNSFAIERISDATFWLNSEARFIYVNEAACRNLGYTREELLGMTVFDIDPDFSPEIWPAHWEETKKVGFLTIESKHRAKDGRVYPVEVGINYLKFGDKEYHCSFARDIASRKRAEERLARLNECLLGFGPDSIENINRLTRLCGELMGGCCALYNRLEKGLFCSWGQWNTPADYKAIDKPDGHICFDVIHRADEDIVVIQDLPNTVYAKTDPNVGAYQLKTYVGRAVKFDDQAVGSLCVVFRDAYTPSEDDKRLMNVIASAIGVEERRKHAEDALGVEKAYLKRLFESAPEAIVVVDNQSRVMRANSEFTRMFGYSSEEARGRSIDELLAPANLQEEALALTKQVVAGQSISLESVRQRKDGTLVDVSILGSPVMVGDGQVAVYAIYRDITDRKQAEEELQLSEAKSQAILSAIPDIMFQINKEGVFLSYRGRKEDLYLSPDEFLGKNIHDVLPNEVADQAMRYAQLTLQRGGVQIFEYELTIQGEQHYYESRMVGGGEDTVLAIIRDITNRKRADNTREIILNINKLLLGELDLERAIDMVSTELQKLIPHDLLAFHIVYKDLDQVETFLTSPAGRRHLSERAGTKNPYREAFQGSLTQQILHERRDRLQARIPDGGTYFDERLRALDMNSFVALPLINVGVPMGMLLLANQRESAFSLRHSELLEQIHLQLVLWIQHLRLIERLSDSESKLRNLFDNSNDAIYILQGTRFVYINRKFEELLEYKLEEVNRPDFNFQRLVAPESIPLIEERSRRTQAGEKLPSNYEFKGLSRSGKVLDFDVNVSYITFDGEPAVQGILRDISERKRFEEKEKEMQIELMQHSKLASIGMLAAGIAHNINVPLQGISNHIEMLKLTRDDIPYVDAMHTQVQRISAIINNMLYKSRQEQDQRVREIDLNQLLVEELTFLDADLAFKHEVEKEYLFDPNLPKIQGIYSDFSQALLNIIKNALDAMHGRKKKKLRVKTEALAQGGMLIEVADTGHGIAPEHRAHIFEPFFTTKPPNGEQNGGEPTGTGLGLSTSHQLLKKYDAKFSVESEVGEGTAIRIYIPGSEDSRQHGEAVSTDESCLELEEIES